MKKYRIDEITDNLDNLRKPLNNLERAKISKRKLYPYYGANSLMDYVDEYIFDEEILCVAEDGGSWGYREKCSYIVNEKCWVNNHAHVLRAKNNLNIKYLNYYLNYNDFSSSITGTTRGKLTKSALSSIEVLLPELKKQNEIVRVLDKAQELINKRKEQIQALDELVKSKFIEMFGDIKKNSKNFKMSKIGSCAKLQGGYAFKSKDFVEEGIKLVQISNVNKDTLDWDSINYLPREYIEKYNNYSLNFGDIVMAMTRPIIKSLNAVKIAFVTEKDTPCLLNQRVGRFVVNNDIINNIYLVEVCKSTYFKEYVERVSGNSLQPNVSSKQVEDLDIPIPPIEFQNQFAEFVKQVDEMKLKMENSLKELEDNFNSLMQKAFKGELF